MLLFFINRCTACAPFRAGGKRNRRVAPGPRRRNRPASEQEFATGILGNADFTYGIGEYVRTVMIKKTV